MSAAPDRRICTALPEVQGFSRAPTRPSAEWHRQGGALDQLGLVDGDRIVLEYRDHGEAGLALEHLIDTAKEPALPLSTRTFSLIKEAGRALEMDAQLWEPLRGRVVDG